MNLQGIFSDYNTIKPGINNKFKTKNPNEWKVLNNVELLFLIKR